MGIPAVINGTQVCATGIAVGRLVTLLDNDLPPHSNGMAHELMHVFLLDITGSPNGGHDRQEWGYVLDINNYLHSAGY